jgi:hypothetical protein
MPKKCLEFRYHKYLIRKGSTFLLSIRNLTSEEHMWESDQDAGTISSVLFATAGTTVCHSLKHFECN